VQVMRNEFDDIEILDDLDEFTTKDVTNTKDDNYNNDDIFKYDFNFENNIVSDNDNKLNDILKNDIDDEINFDDEVEKDEELRNTSMPNIDYEYEQPLYDPSLSIQINREDVMEDALSHTTRFTPFKLENEEDEMTNKNNNKGVAFIIILFALLMAFVLLLPKISEIIG